MKKFLNWFNSLHYLIQVVIILTSIYFLISFFIRDDTENKNESVENSNFSNNIPGLSPVDIYLNLEKKGFNIEKNFSNGSTWICTLKDDGIDYKVTIYSSDVNTVETIKATSTIDYNTNIKNSKQFFKYLTSCPYKDNNPTKVGDWIEENFNNDKATITVSKVKFTLFVPSKYARILTIERER